MRYRYKTWWFQLIIWGSIFLFFLMIMSQFKEISFALFAASYTTLAMLLVQVLSSRKLIPLYQKGNKNAIPITVVTLLFFAIILGTIEHLSIDKFNIDLQSKERPPIFFFYIRQFFVFSFIFFINYAIYLWEQTIELRIEQKQLSEEKLETELKLLKAQINPHFIFNALNNIYSLTYMQSKNAPESVLKLSDMLRYVFYDCSKDKVPISSEIKYIENFSAFQQMKSDYKQNITMNVTLNNSLIEVAPMLLIPLIENAFKYSRIEEDEKAYVTIDICQKKKTLCILIKNSIPENNKPLEGSGMGIANVRHRLDIIYANAHTLDVNESNNTFEVNLEFTF